MKDENDELNYLIVESSEPIVFTIPVLKDGMVLNVKSKGEVIINQVRTDDYRDGYKKEH